MYAREERVTCPVCKGTKESPFSGRTCGCCKGEGTITLASARAKAAIRRDLTRACLERGINPF